MRPADRRLADTLFAGAVLAYPTEGVYGLGCIPDDRHAVMRLLSIKQRDPDKGLILIAADRDQLEGWVADGVTGKLDDPDPKHPVTWIVPPGPLAHAGITGSHDGIAVRLSGHPVASELCRHVGMPITSTSANIAGRPTARNKYVLHRIFRDLADGIVSGDCGPAKGPSEIRVLSSGAVLR